VLTLVFVGGGLAAVLVVRPPASPPPPAPGAPAAVAAAPAGDGAAAVAGLTTPVIVPPALQAAGTMPTTVGPRAAPAPAHPREADRVSAWLDRWDTTSTDTGDWRDTVAAALGPRAVEHAPLRAGAVHSHVASPEPTVPDAAAPAPAAAGATGGSPELQGWDGGPFWFGPNGLVRVREVAE
jgi:hypothetical protein